MNSVSNPPGIVDQMYALVQRQRFDLVLTDLADFRLKSWRDVRQQHPVLPLYTADLQF